MTQSASEVTRYASALPYASTRPNIQCDSTRCWCNDQDYHRKWIPSLGIDYTVEELPRPDNRTQPDNSEIPISQKCDAFSELPNNVRMFRYVYIEATA